MLGQGDIDALLAARHPDPFAVLGLHADAAGKLWVRALLPGAASIELLDAATAARDQAIASLGELELLYPDAAPA